MQFLGNINVTEWRILQLIGRNVVTNKIMLLIVIIIQNMNI
jgi:hypothetical protein